MRNPSNQHMTLSQIDSLPLEETSFGEYMRHVRLAKALSLDELGEKLGKGAVYLGEIERGRRNPPDSPLLDQIIEALVIQETEHLVIRFYDLAAFGRLTVPADITQYIMDSPELRKLIRKGKAQNCTDSDWAKIAQTLSNP
jgi:transcriptional regulator with XRE-family HTH domain